MLTNGGENVLPVNVSDGDIFDFHSIKTNREGAFNDIAKKSGVDADEIKNVYEKTADINKYLEKAGYKGARDAGTLSGGEQVVIFNPKNIRSKNAAFDPQFRNSSNLLGASTAKNLAGVAGLTSALVAAPVAYNQVTGGRSGKAKKKRKFLDLRQARLTDKSRTAAMQGNKKASDYFKYQADQMEIDKRGSEYDLLGTAQIGANMVGAEARDFVAGASGLGNQFGHNVADGLEKHFGKDYADIVRPKKTPAQLVTGLKQAGIDISESQMENAMNNSPEMVEQLYALDGLITKGAQIGRETLDHYPVTKGMDVGANFNQSVEDLSKVTPLGASILKGAPDVI